jgi:hypothetical protein
VEGGGSERPEEAGEAAPRRLVMTLSLPAACSSTEHSRSPYSTNCSTVDAFFVMEHCTQRQRQRQESQPNSSGTSPCCDKSNPLEYLLRTKKTKGNRCVIEVMEILHDSKKSAVLYVEISMLRLFVDIRQ